MVHYLPDKRSAADMARFDYVLLLYRPEFTVPPGLSLQRIGQGMTYTLARVVRN